MDCSYTLSLPFKEERFSTCLIFLLRSRVHDPLYPGVSGTENEKPQMSRVLKNGLGVIVLNARRSTLTSRNIRATTNDQTCENTKQDFLILAYIVHSCCFLDYFPVSCTCFPTS